MYRIDDGGLRFRRRYADTNTAMLTSSAPAPGDTLRFYGLVFNDHGTLRMDCARISPGVTELSQ